MEDLEKDLIELHNLYEKAEKHVLNLRKQGHIIYPKQEDILNCLKYCELDEIKVIILGQDVYTGPDQANGLAFSVNAGVKIPPSLQNIFTELKNDIVIDFPTHGDLTSWAQQGVILLNRVLTVEEGKPLSHYNIIGWEVFTDLLIKIIDKYSENIAFLLWGSKAAELEKIINNKKHLILKASHPSPLSAHRGFFGCKHFSKVNRYLISRGRDPIYWSV